MHILSRDYIKEKWANAGFQKYFKNTGWMFASRIICMGIAFLTTIFIARKLGPGNYGQLSYAVSFISIFSVLASLGIDSILFRDLVKYPEKRKEYLGSAIAIKLIAGLITAIIIFIFATFFAQDDVSKVLILILSWTFIFGAFGIVSFDFQARVKSKYPSIIAVVITLILNILRVIIIITGKGVIYLAFVLLLESILYSVFYWYFYEKKIEGGKITELKLDKNIVISLLKDSWPLIFTSAFALIYARIDQVFIKHMLDAKAVGIYSAGVTLSEVWYFIPGLIISSVFPAIVNAKKTSEEIYHSRLKKLSSLLFILSLSISLVVTMIAPYLINLIYGSAFAGATIILQIYVWACVGTFFSYLIDSYLVTENNKKIMIFKTFIPMAINVILNLLWIPKYGIVGSAYATLISYSFAPLSLLLFKETREDISKIFFKK